MTSSPRGDLCTAVIGTKIEVRRPHPSFRRTPDSCSAGTVPHPVPGCCRQLGLATAEPFSSLGVPVATGMSDCYSNEPRPQTPSFPRRACPRAVGGGNPSPVAATDHVATENPAPIFIPLCGLRKAMVIPAEAGIQGRGGPGWIASFPFPCVALLRELRKGLPRGKIKPALSLSKGWGLST